MLSFTDRQKEVIAIISDENYVDLINYICIFGYKDENNLFTNNESLTTILADKTYLDDISQTIS